MPSKKVKSKVSKSEESIILESMAKSPEPYDEEAIDAANKKRLRKAVAKHAVRRFDERQAKTILAWEKMTKLKEKVKMGTNTSRDDYKLDEYYVQFEKLESKQEAACGGNKIIPDFYLNPEQERRRKKLAKKAKKARSKERALEP